MKAVLTGAAGFVGRHLRRELGCEHTIIPTARRKTDVDTEVLDLTDADSVSAFISAHRDDGIDAIVHAASVLVNADMTYEKQFAAFSDNVRMADSVITIVRELNIKTLVNFSSIAVYPNEDGKYDEHSETKMSSNSEFFYGLSKLVAENMFDHALAGICRVVNFRMAQIYGEGMRSDRIIPMMAESVKRDNMIEVYGEGERTSCFIPVEKACTAVGYALVDTSLSGTYNVGYETLSYLELAERVKEKYGNDDTKIVKVKRGSRAKFILDTDKWDSYLRGRWDK
ncbi:MAG: NAD(P)-dependent oxidoreductase [Lachnospiraceae bacterium]|nr:NAD(P)-dependent oxidoreductase [Lachnospiraceae bacterium]